MNARRVMRLFLVTVFLLGAAAAWYTAPLLASDPARGDVSTTAIDSQNNARDGIIVYYFHGTRRCNTCRTIEAYAEEAIAGRYGAQLESGRLRWEVINTDEPDNEHFVEDFGLVSSSLVVVELHDDQVTRHNVLQDAWVLVRDKPRFIEYVQGAIGEFLKS